MFLRRFARWALLLSGIFSVSLLFLIFVPYGGSRGIRFEVPPGATARATAELLRENGVIVSERLFRAVAKVRGSASSLQAGLYEMEGRVSLWGAVTMLARGRVRLLRVTIPEGWASRQIASRLESLHVCSGDRFLSVVRKDRAEGFLFPQTYFMRPGMSAAGAAALMEKEFERNWRRSFAGLSAPAGLDRRGVVTLASIVEREAKRDFERPLVSAVFLNRLNKRWRLESCATVQYSLGEWKPVLSLDDLKTPSPYNTYLHGGLPPGPICSPGLPSLRSVFFPARTAALFFLADGQGTHSFYTTYREHAAGKARRKRRRKP